MKPNKGNISRIPARFILNPGISGESDLSSDSDNEIYEAVNNNKTSDSDWQKEDEPENDSDVVTHDLPSSSNGQQSNSKLKWHTADPEHVTIRDLPFTGIPSSGPLIPEEPIDYFRDIFTDELLLRTFKSNKFACLTS